MSKKSKMECGSMQADAVEMATDCGDGGCGGCGCKKGQKKDKQ